MITINFASVENRVLPDRHLMELLPEFRDLFLSWRMSQSSPSLRSLGKKSAIELLNSLEDRHVKILSDYFKESVEIRKLDHRLVIHAEVPEDIDDFPSNFADFCLTTGPDGASITFWR